LRTEPDDPLGGDWWSGLVADVDELVAAAESLGSGGRPTVDQAKAARAVANRGVVAVAERRPTRPPTPALCDALVLLGSGVFWALGRLLPAEAGGVGP
jgi:hypothetical protein